MKTNQASSGTSVVTYNKLEPHCNQQKELGRATHQNSLHGSLRHLLDLGADLVVGGVLGQANGQVDDGHVGGRDSEGHAGQLAVKLGDDLADGLGGSGRGRDDVLGSAAAVTPGLARGSIDGLLGCERSKRIASGSSHQTSKNT